jgi:hypothetical protein
MVAVQQAETGVLIVEQGKQIVAGIYAGQHGKSFV